MAKEVAAYFFTASTAVFFIELANAMTEAIVYEQTAHISTTGIVAIPVAAICAGILSYNGK